MGLLAAVLFWFAMGILAGLAVVAAINWDRKTR